MTGWGAGCFNVGCAAEPVLEGGAVEWARRVLRLATRGEAWRVLQRDFAGGRVVSAAPAPRVPDFCRFPEAMRQFEPHPLGSPMQDAFAVFARKQWGLDDMDLRLWLLGWCMRGPHAFRIVIPVMMGGRAVGFQARAIRSGAEPKYLTSRHGPESDPEAECGRLAASMLFNADAMRDGGEVVLVEGPGDVMAWARSHPESSPAVGLLGVALTPAKLAMIAERRPSLVVVALDNEPAARRRALAHVEDLRAWGLGARIGRWEGGKDAGSGADLIVEDEATLSSAVRARLNR